MCGHVGVAGSPGQKERAVLSTLLYFDVLRGPHSTGIAAIDVRLDKDTKEDYQAVFVFKSVGEPQKLYEKYPKDFPKGVYNYATDVLIGHNRWATQGAVNDDNAHPFEFENVIGAHNGTVTQWSMKDFHDNKQYDIDSQMIFAQLNHDNDLQKVWDKADGAMALVWWDKRDKRLHMARNKERSLFYTYTKDKSCIFWASEDWMLKIACGRAGVEIGEVRPIIEDKHYTFSVEKLAVEEWSSDLVPFVDPWAGWESNYASTTTMGYKPYVAPKFEWVKVKVTEWNHTGKADHEGFFIGKTEADEEIVIRVSGWEVEKLYNKMVAAINDPDKEFRFKSTHAWFDKNMRHVHAAAIDITSKANPPAEAEVGFAVGFRGQKLNSDEWLKATQNGCSFCAAELLWMDRAETKWYGEDECICFECAGNDAVQRWLKTSVDA